MKRKYKLFIIIVVSSIITYYIFFTTINKDINIMSMGDGVSSGQISATFDGISYNDYLKDYYKSINLLGNFDNTYSFKNNTIDKLINNINNNDKKNKYIKQIIHKSDIITICVGEEELINNSIINELDISYITSFISKYSLLLNNIKELTDANVIVIGFYENDYLNKSNTIILNSELSNIVKKYNYSFINIVDLLIDDKYYLNKDKKYFNNIGHKKIAELILNTL